MKAKCKQKIADELLSAFYASPSRFDRHCPAVVYIQLLITQPGPPFNKSNVLNNWIYIESLLCMWKCDPDDRDRAISPPHCAKSWPKRPLYANYRLLATSMLIFCVFVLSFPWHKLRWCYWVRFLHVFESLRIQICANVFVLNIRKFLIAAVPYNLVEIRCTRDRPLCIQYCRIRLYCMWYSKIDSICIFCICVFSMV